MSARPEGAFEIVHQHGVSVVYAVDDAARRSGMAGEALARAIAVLEAVRELRNGVLSRPDLATAVLVDRAIELVKAGAALADSQQSPKPPGWDVPGEDWSDVVMGREDWLVGARTHDGEIVPQAYFGEGHS